MNEFMTPQEAQAMLDFFKVNYPGLLLLIDSPNNECTEYEIILFQAIRGWNTVAALI